MPRCEHIPRSIPEHQPYGDDPRLGDFCGGRFHKHNPLPLPELDRLRWPPLGCRACWVRYGPDGPPAGDEAVSA